MYTQNEPKNMDDAKMQNQTFSTEYKSSYHYGVDKK
jgi:hypothetical protein